MVYGRILYNNIKEYTPKWFKTVPYAQTTKPTFGRIESYCRPTASSRFQLEQQTGRQEILVVLRTERSTKPMDVANGGLRDGIRLVPHCLRSVPLGLPPEQ